MKKIAVLLICAAAAVGLAQAHDLLNCRWKDGREMSQRDCDLFRRLAAEDAAAEQRARAHAEASRQRAEEDERVRAEKKAAAKAQEDQRTAERQAKMAADEAEGKALRTRLDREDTAREAAVRKVCGKDYGSLRVGMALARYRQCNEDPSYVTQTVTQGRVMQTWRGTFNWLHIVDGVIVGYTERH